uniref:Ragulator complex protein LAMTOR1 n=1 Tax=Strongyloides venezuelensis TaxID=75913 RepID=A0A0K0FQ18_STRVS
MKTCNDNCKCELERKYGQDMRQKQQKPETDNHHQEVKVEKKPRSRMHRLCARLCPCFCGDDEDYRTGLLSDEIYTPAQQVRPHRSSETNNTSNSESSRRTGSQNTSSVGNKGLRHSQSIVNQQLRMSIREVDPEDEEYQIQQVLLRARENILTSDDFAYGVDQMPDFENKMHLYKEELSKYDAKIRRNGKENLKPPQILLEEDDNYINLLKETKSIPLEESNNITGMLQKLNTTFKKMNTINFEEPLVVHMTL